MYTLVLKYKGQEVVAENDGYIGQKFQENSNFELQIVVPIDSTIKVLHLIKSRGEFSPTEIKANYCDEQFYIYTALFSVKKTTSGYLRAVQSHNGKNFILIDCGNEIVHKVGIVSQAGKFYLLDRVICKAPEREACESENIGIVEWFDVFSGIGCIRVKQGMIRIYWDCLLNKRGLVEPAPGEWIVFLRLTTPSILANTTFQQEIEGNALCYAKIPNKNTLRATLDRLVRLENTATQNNSGFTVTLGDIANIIKLNQ